MVLVVELFQVLGRIQFSNIKFSFSRVIRISFSMSQVAREFNKLKSETRYEEFADRWMIQRALVSRCKKSEKQIQVVDIWYSLQALLLLFNFVAHVKMYIRI